MLSSIKPRQHAPAALVAALVVAACLPDGAFDPKVYAAASIVIWAALIAGLLSRALPAASVAPTAAVAGVCLAGIVVLAAASVAWAGDQGRAFQEAVRASAYLGLFALAACTASRGARSQWLGGLGAGLGIVSVLALVSYLQPGLLEGDELDRLIPTAAGRASYPIGYWNGLGALVASAVVLLAWGGVRAPARWLRATAVGLLPLCLLLAWLTGSRGGAVAVLLGLAILVAASGERGRQLLVVVLGALAALPLIAAAETMDALTGDVVDAAMRTDGDRMTAFAMLGAAAAGAAAWALDGRVLWPRLSGGAAKAVTALAAVAIVAAVIAADPVERFDEFRSPPEGTQVAVSSDFNSSGRWQFWTAATDAFESAPVAGIGAGAYEDWWARHASLPVYVRNPHSLPLQQVAELGLAGILLGLGFAAAVALAAWRRLGAGLEGDAGVLTALVAGAALTAAIDWTWAIPAVAAPALLAAGLLSASAPGRSGVASTRPGSYWLALGTVAIGWLSVVAASLLVLTELKLEGSREAAAQGKPIEAMERAEEARTVQPWSPEPYTQMALLEEARGDSVRALERLAQARERDSDDWRLALFEARLHRGLGDAGAAYSALQEARDLSPVFGG